MFLTIDLNTTPCGPPWQLLDLEAQSNSVINSFPHLEELSKEAQKLATSLVTWAPPSAT